MLNHMDLFSPRLSLAWWFFFHPLSWCVQTLRRCCVTLAETEPMFPPLLLCFYWLALEKLGAFLFFSDSLCAFWSASFKWQSFIFLTCDSRDLGSCSFCSFAHCQVFSRWLGFLSRVFFSLLNCFCWALTSNPVWLLWRLTFPPPSLLILKWSHMLSAPKGVFPGSQLGVCETFVHWQNCQKKYYR